MQIMMQSPFSQSPLDSGDGEEDGRRRPIREERREGVHGRENKCIVRLFHCLLATIFREIREQQNKKVEKWKVPEYLKFRLCKHWPAWPSGFFAWKRSTSQASSSPTYSSPPSNSWLISV
jgi:hypothetical protein